MLSQEPNCHKWITQLRRFGKIIVKLLAALMATSPYAINKIRKNQQNHIRKGSRFVTRI